MDFIRICLGLDFNPCFNKRAKKTEIILEELKDPKQEKSEIRSKNTGFNHEEQRFEPPKNETFKKDMKIEKSVESNIHISSSILERKSDTKIATREKFQTQKNMISIEDNNFKIIIDETNTELAKSLSSKHVDKKLNYLDSGKFEIKNSLFTNNSNNNLNNTTKMDSVHSIKRDKDVECYFNAEFGNNFNSIGKVEDKSISPIISKKKIEKKRMKKMRELDSMREDLKKWAF